MDSDVSADSIDRSQRILKEFIHTYKGLPELWDPRDENYANKYRRVVAQDKLLAVLRKLQSDATRLDVRKKINTLRSNYNKKMNRYRESQAEGIKWAVNKSWQFQELRFLDTIKKFDCSNSMKREVSEAEHDLESGGEKDERIETETVCDETELATISIKDEQCSFVNIEKIIEGEPEDAVTVTSAPRHVAKRDFKRKIRLQRSIRLQPSKTFTGIEPIALVWSSKLTSLRPTQRMLAEKAINDILFEASMNNLRKGPMMVNTGASSVTTMETEGFTVELPEEYIDYSSTEGGEDDQSQ